MAIFIVELCSCKPHCKHYVAGCGLWHLQPSLMGLQRAMHPTQDRVPDKTRALRFWEACKQLTRWLPSKKDGPFTQFRRRSLAEVSLNDSRREEAEDEDNRSFTSVSTTGTTKQGDASAYLAGVMDDVTPTLHNEVLNLALVRFKDLPEDTLTPARKTS